MKAMTPTELHADLRARQRVALDAATSDQERKKVLSHFGPLICRANSAMQNEPAPEPKWMEKKRASCPHKKREILSHEESRCMACGEIFFTPDE